MLIEPNTNSFCIPFALDETISSPLQPYIYRPWGTRSLKIKTTTRVALPRLWVRPQQTLPEETALGIYKAYADESHSFHLTWGGGHELGPCVKSTDKLAAFESCAPLVAGDTSYLYFNITHTGLDLPTSATVTLRAFDCLGKFNQVIERDHAKLSISLAPPADLPPAEEIIHIIPGRQDNTWVVSPGRYLPTYDSRWWPNPQVNYQQDEPLPLLIRLEKGMLSIAWKEDEHTIAVIEDFTNPSVLLLAESIAYELFAFDRWSVALRIWFFWVDKYHGGGFFIGRHEVPDAERFDLIIRRSDGRVLLAGTDLHWREVWARVLPDKILRATLGMPRDTAIQLAKEKISATWTEIWTKAIHPDERNIASEMINNPMEPYIRKLAEREATVTVKAGGTEAHIPTLHNVEQRRPTVMTSSDVRLG